MPHFTHSRPGRLRAGASLVVLAVVAVALACSKGDDTQTATTSPPSSASLVVEPASEVGPDAFTPSVATDVTICDKAAFLRELQARPDAYREWAKVLNLTTEAIPAYVASLQPVVLSADTSVLNHGLRNGLAYPRPSTLQAGTAVLVDPKATASIGAQPPASVESVPSVSSSMPTNSSTTGTASSLPSTTGPATSSFPSTTGPATTLPGGGLPVTRCKCGNPLLPLGAVSFVPGSATVSTTTPRVTPTPSGPTRSTAPGSSVTSTSTVSSSSTSSSVPTSSSSVPSSSSSGVPPSQSQPSVSQSTPSDSPNAPD